MATPRRKLGITEALISARDQCPNASVREAARIALESVSREGSKSLRDQAFLVLTAAQGWRGEKADAVKQALREFTEAGV